MRRSAGLATTTTPGAATHHHARLLSTSRLYHLTTTGSSSIGGGGGISALLRSSDSSSSQWPFIVTTNNANNARDITTSAVAKSGGNAPTTVAFADLDLCDASLRAIKEVKGFEFATAVQDQTLLPILEGKDTLARAKTGSGKTIGFLLPAIEALMRSGPDVGNDGTVSILVLSPTRELATQIHEETLQLLTFNQRFGAQVVFGGTKMAKDLRTMKHKRCDILVATPGRLIQHLEEGDLPSRLRGCQMLVLDEADRQGDTRCLHAHASTPILYVSSHAHLKKSVFVSFNHNNIPAVRAVVVVSSLHRHDRHRTKPRLCFM